MCAEILSYTCYADGSDSNFEGMSMKETRWASAHDGLFGPVFMAHVALIIVRVVSHLYIFKGVIYIYIYIRFLK